MSVRCLVFAEFYFWIYIRELPTCLGEHNLNATPTCPTAHSRACAHN